MGISALGLDRDLGFCEYIKGIGLMRMTKDNEDEVKDNNKGI